MVLRLGWSLAVIVAWGVPVLAQAPPPPPAGQTQPLPPPVPPPSAPVTPPPSPAAVAATVDGQPIMEMAVYRGLQRLPPDAQAQARPELISFLVDNAIIDQYLLKAKVAVTEAEVEPKYKQVQEEIKKQGMTFEEVMKRFALNEAELRSQIAAQLRWEKFVDTQATNEALRNLFTNSPDLFDGSMVRAKHILITAKGNDVQSVEQARGQAMQLKKQIEDAAAQALAIQPAGGDNLAREKARSKAIDEKFSEVAATYSMCPSKKQGGDLGFFPRAGSMVEPFAKAAFSLREYQLSDVVTTQFGCHLILVTERKPGKPVKFDEMKEEIKDVFGDRLRDAMLAQLRPQARIVINPAPR